MINSICHKFPGYKNTTRIDIHCEIQAVPFAQLSLMTFILDTVCLDGKMSRTYFYKG